MAMTATKRAFLLYRNKYIYCVAISKLNVSVTRMCQSRCLARPFSSASSQSQTKTKGKGLSTSQDVQLPNIVFHDDNIVAINKPWEQTVYGQSSQRNSDERPLALMLPKLSQHLDSEDLNIGLSLKSYYSGLVLLTKGPSSAKRLQKVLSFATSQKKLFLTYLAIVVGKPQCELQERKEMYLERLYMHDREMSVVCDKSVHSARKEGKMIQTAFSLRTISSNDASFSSLVEIKVNKDKLDAIPVLLSHFLSPVLGDVIYSSRTNYLMGVPIPLPPHIALPGQQRLPIRTENALWDPFKLEINPLPLFIHRHRVTLPDFPSRSSIPYEVTAPPPAYFTTALECLGLKLSDHR